MADNTVSNVKIGSIVTLSSESGAKIYYSKSRIDATVISDPLTEYTGTAGIAITEPTILSYRAIDSAGNQENINYLRINTKFPTSQPLPDSTLSRFTSMCNVKGTNSYICLPGDGRIYKSYNCGAFSLVLNDSQYKINDCVSDNNGNVFVSGVYPSAPTNSGKGFVGISGDGGNTFTFSTLTSLPGKTFISSAISFNKVSGKIGVIFYDSTGYFAFWTNTDGVDIFEQITVSNASHFTTASLKLSPFESGKFIVYGISSTSMVIINPGTNDTSYTYEMSNPTVTRKMIFPVDNMNEKLVYMYTYMPGPNHINTTIYQPVDLQSMIDTTSKFNTVSNDNISMVDFDAIDYDFISDDRLLLSGYETITNNYYGQVVKIEYSGGVFISPISSMKTLSSTTQTGIFNIKAGSDTAVFVTIKKTPTPPTPSFSQMSISIDHGDSWGAV